MRSAVRTPKSGVQSFTIKYAFILHLNSKIIFQQPTSQPQYWPPQQHQRPQIITQQQSYPAVLQQHVPTQSSLYPPSSSSVKHEHFHYHYPTKDNYHSESHSFNKLDGKTEIVTAKQNPSYAVHSPPLYIKPDMSPYKHQYKGDPYKKRADDDDTTTEYALEPYFPIKARSEDKEGTTTEQMHEITDKNSRKML